MRLSIIRAPRSSSALHVTNHCPPDKATVPSPVFFIAEKSWVRTKPDNSSLGAGYLYPGSKVGRYCISRKITEDDLFRRTTEQKGELEDVVVASSFNEVVVSDTPFLLEPETAQRPPDAQRYRQLVEQVLSSKRGFTGRGPACLPRMSQGWREQPRRGHGKILGNF
ncbi:hypothetical protein Bbelb_398440 [Branchiostoma belcheri]|nr:hypothetical protein Bbelb_444070 [Branchiostoma belcheri]KAI8482448.1 hypothetical protein Bbelb_398440 [Branchiostoma belcheri]